MTWSLQKMRAFIVINTCGYARNTAVTALIHSLNLILPIQLIIA